MTRVLSIVPMPYVSGLQNMVLGFFGQLSAEIEPHFLLTRWSDGEFARRLDQLGLAYSHSWLGFFSRSLRPEHIRMTLHCASKLPELYGDFWRLLKSFDPDVIYMANYHELMLLWPVLRLAGRPVVCHMADPAPARPFYRACARLYDQVVSSYIAISESVRERLVVLGISAAKIRLLHPGLVLSEVPLRRPRTALFTQRYGWPERSVVVGMTGQLIAVKGHEDLVDAAALVCGAEPGARFVIGGKAEGRFYESLVARVEGLGLGERVRFTGWQASVSDFFAGIDIAAVPSRQEEGFGLVAAEAMATGVPVVATARGGLRDIVEHGASGLLVAEGRPRQLAAAFMLLAHAPALRERMGAAGRRAVEAQFDLRKQACELERQLTAASTRGQERAL